jgi:hypothetical protein
MDKAMHRVHGAHDYLRKCLPWPSAMSSNKLIELCRAHKHQNEHIETFKVNINPVYAAQ